MPGVVFAGHVGGALLHVIVPVHEPGSVPVGTQVGAQPLASHCSTHCEPSPQVVVAHVESETQVAGHTSLHPTLLHGAHCCSQ